MDWLNENVVGTIPAYQELNDTGKATVEIAGVASSRKETNAEAVKSVPQGGQAAGQSGTEQAAQGEKKP